MIGLDTNVLVRLLAADDADQTAIIINALASEPDRPIVVNSVVFAEIVWVLKSVYRHDRQEIAAALDYLTRIERIFIPDRAAVLEAVSRYGKSDGRADFADYLIQSLNAAAGAVLTWTFDTKAAAEPGFAQVPAGA